MLTSFPSICIWRQGLHSAFTDLIRFNEHWLCCFREADAHACTKRKGGSRDGIIRLLRSPDGVEWLPSHEFVHEGMDLRDPHFSVTSDNRLMLSAVGRKYSKEGGDDGQYVCCQSFCAFSTDGQDWTDLQHSGESGPWIWQVRWHDGYAYSWIRNPEEAKPCPLRLLCSPDGLDWKETAYMESGNEAALLIKADGSMLSLVRNENSFIGHSEPPYTDWKWTRLGRFIGGPVLLELSNGLVVAGGRLIDPPEIDESTLGARTAVTVLACLDLKDKSYTPVLRLPSGGDCGYPGLYEHDGMVWTSYYSSHEGRSAIYLAQIPVAAFEGFCGACA